MDNQYYCECNLIDGSTGFYTFSGNDKQLPRYKLNQIWESHRVWREDKNGVHWMKNKIRDMATMKLTQDELKEFMWIKLKAQNI